MRRIRAVTIFLIVVVLSVSLIPLSMEEKDSNSRVDIRSLADEFPTTTIQPVTTTTTSTIPTTTTTVPPSTTTTTAPPQAISEVREAPPGPSGDVWYQLRMCESGNNYQANTGNGYYGAYQFSAPTWRSMGTAYNFAHEAPPEVQDDAARRLQARSGWGQWPACSRKIGVR